MLFCFMPININHFKLYLYKIYNKACYYLKFFSLYFYNKYLDYEKKFFIIEI